MNPTSKSLWGRVISTLTLLLALAPMVFADLPTPYSSEQITGEIDKIDNIKVWGKDCRVIRLSNATGFDRKAANSLFKIIRRSGYEPQRKTLRDNEIVVVLTDADASKLIAGDQIRIDRYLIAAHDNRTLATQGEAKLVTKTNKNPNNKAVSGNRR